jgi:hypothetical protein
VIPVVKGDVFDMAKTQSSKAPKPSKSVKRRKAARKPEAGKPKRTAKGKAPRDGKPKRTAKEKVPRDGKPKRTAKGKAPRDGKAGKAAEKSKAGKAAKTGRKAEAKDPALQSNLAVEAHHIRMMLREISQRFVNDLESEVVRIIELIGEIPGGARKRAEMQKIIQNMRNLKVKPNKGRMRDLREIRDLIQQTNQRLEELL